MKWNGDYTLYWLTLAAFSQMKAEGLTKNLSPKLLTRAVSKSCFVMATCAYKLDLACD